MSPQKDGDLLTSPLSVGVGMAFQVVGDSSQFSPLVDPQPGSSFLPIFQVQSCSTRTIGAKALAKL